MRMRISWNNSPKHHIQLVESSTNSSSSSRGVLPTEDPPIRSFQKQQEQKQQRRRQNEDVSMVLPQTAKKQPHHHHQQDWDITSVTEATSDEDYYEYEATKQQQHHHHLDIQFSPTPTTTTTKMAKTEIRRCLETAATGGAAAAATTQVAESHAVSPKKCKTAVVVKRRVASPSKNNNNHGSSRNSSSSFGYVSASTCSFSSKDDSIPGGDNSSLEEDLDVAVGLKKKKTTTTTTNGQRSSSTSKKRTTSPRKTATVTPTTDTSSGKEQRHKKQPRSNSLSLASLPAPPSNDQATDNERSCKSLFLISSLCSSPIMTTKKKKATSSKSGVVADAISVTPSSTTSTSTKRSSSRGRSKTPLKKSSACGTTTPTSSTTTTAASTPTSSFSSSSTTSTTASSTTTTTTEVVNGGEPGWMTKVRTSVAHHAVCSPHTWKSKLLEKVHPSSAAATKSSSYQQTSEEFEEPLLQDETIDDKEQANDDNKEEQRRTREEGSSSSKPERIKIRCKAVSKSTTKEEPSKSKSVREGHTKRKHNSRDNDTSATTTPHSSSSSTTTTHTASTSTFLPDFLKIRCSDVLDISRRHRRHHDRDGNMKRIPVCRENSCDGFSLSSMGPPPSTTTTLDSSISSGSNASKNTLPSTICTMNTLPSSISSKRNLSGPANNHRNMTAGPSILKSSFSTTLPSTLEGMDVLHDQHSHSSFSDADDSSTLSEWEKYGSLANPISPSCLVVVPKKTTTTSGQPAMTSPICETDDLFFSDDVTDEALFQSLEPPAPIHDVLTSLHMTTAPIQIVSSHHHPSCSLPAFTSPKRERHVLSSLPNDSSSSRSSSAAVFKSTNSNPLRGLGDLNSQAFLHSNTKRGCEFWDQSSNDNSSSDDDSSSEDESLEDEPTPPVRSQQPSMFPPVPSRGLPTPTKVKVASSMALPLSAKSTSRGATNRPAIDTLSFAPPLTTASEHRQDPSRTSNHSRKNVDLTAPDDHDSNDHSESYYYESKNPQKVIAPKDFEDCDAAELSGIEDCHDMSERSGGRLVAKRRRRRPSTTCLSQHFGDLSVSSHDNNMMPFARRGSLGSIMSSPAVPGSAYRPRQTSRRSSLDGACSTTSSPTFLVAKTPRRQSLNFVPCSSTSILSTVHQSPRKSRASFPGSIIESSTSSCMSYSFPMHDTKTCMKKDELQVAPANWTDCLTTVLPACSELEGFTSDSSTMPFEDLLHSGALLEAETFKHEEADSAAATDEIVVVQPRHKMSNTKHEENDQVKPGSGDMKPNRDETGKAESTTRKSRSSDKSSSPKVSGSQSKSKVSKHVDENSAVDCMSPRLKNKTSHSSEGTSSNSQRAKRSSECAEPASKSPNTSKVPKNTRISRSDESVCPKSTSKSSNSKNKEKSSRHESLKVKSLSECADPASKSKSKRPKSEDLVSKDACSRISDDCTKPMSSNSNVKITQRRDGSMPESPSKVRSSTISSNVKVSATKNRSENFTDSPKEKDVKTQNEVKCESRTVKRESLSPLKKKRPVVAGNCEVVPNQTSHGSMYCDATLGEATSSAKSAQKQVTLESKKSTRDRETTGKSAEKPHERPVPKESDKTTEKRRSSSSKEPSRKSSCNSREQTVEEQSTTRLVSKETSTKSSCGSRNPTVDGEERRGKGETSNEKKIRETVHKQSLRSSSPTKSRRVSHSSEKDEFSSTRECVRENGRKSDSTDSKSRPRSPQKSRNQVSEQTEKSEDRKMSKSKRTSS